MLSIKLSRGNNIKRNKIETSPLHTTKKKKDNCKKQIKNKLTNNEKNKRTEH